MLICPICLKTDKLNIMEYRAFPQTIKVIKSLCSWLLVLIITLTLLELILRFSDQLPVHKNPLGGFHSPDSTLGWIGKSNYSGRFRRKDFDVVIEHDELGFRHSTYDGSPPIEGAERIIFLGDSFTWGWGIENDKIFTNVLQQKVGGKYIVKNFGVNAYGTSQQLLLFDKHVGQLKPNVVVVMFFSNDIDDNVDAKNGKRPWFELDGEKLVPRNQPVTAISIGPVKRLAQESVAISTLKYTYHLLADMLKNPPVEIVVEEEMAIPEKRWKLLGVLLGELKKRCGGEILECELRIVYVPTREEVRTYHTDEFSLVASRVKAICDEVGISFLDLRPGLHTAWQQEESRKPDVTPIYFPHDGHWDLAGHHAVAQILFNSWAMADDRL